MNCSICDGNGRVDLPTGRPVPCRACMQRKKLIVESAVQLFAVIQANDPKASYRNTMGIAVGLAMRALDSAEIETKANP